jgi:hypothetical protein
MNGTPPPPPTHPHRVEGVPHTGPGAHLRHPRFIVPRARSPAPWVAKLEPKPNLSIKEPPVLGRTCTRVYIPVYQNMYQVYCVMSHTCTTRASLSLASPSSRSLCAALAPASSTWFSASTWEKATFVRKIGQEQ